MPETKESVTITRKQTKDGTNDQPKYSQVNQSKPVINGNPSHNDKIEPEVNLVGENDNENEIPTNPNINNVIKDLSIQNNDESPNAKDEKSSNDISQESSNDESQIEFYVTINTSQNDKGSFSYFLMSLKKFRVASSLRLLNFPINHAHLFF